MSGPPPLVLGLPVLCCLVLGFPSVLRPSWEVQETGPKRWLLRKAVAADSLPEALETERLDLVFNSALL